MSQLSFTSPPSAVPALFTGTGRSRVDAPRWCTRLAAVVLLLFFLPVLVCSAVAVKVTSRGPVFFRQTRLGLGGVPFTLWKLRTMYPDAEAVAKDLRARHGWGAVPLFKLARDPRTTVVGHWLRRSSVDELPQLINVIRGEMALIGPRPALLEEAALWERRHYERLLVLPGMTGLWQVCGRSALSWRTAMALDLHYVWRRSLSMDAWILLRTVPAVLRGRGAY
ncbi:sugar transferase [Streptomyces sp. UNOC14_S4]|uniref:sugar transferase n=1 Tax=Streptomyces sp. UNOC14_S4 TaxID=2872340 RepID=UPI001E3DF109|nr:sugar transferase [Streptomyces sp. UNOC14_S4]MCC3768840.1 sugar transferase [Streptomyces sp. UNOC14_S4]